MNKPSYINIYQTISPNKFYAYSKWIPEICFGIKLGSNEQSSFISNHINGHFSYNVNQNIIQYQRHLKQNKKQKISL